MKKIPFLVTIILLLLVTISCSAVFKAGVSGSVRDLDTDEPIAQMRVFAYTNKAHRDADFSSWSADSENIGFITGRVGMTNTANDGTFTINPIVWESTNPVFGKTADWLDVYLIFYHEDYGLTTNEKMITILSDSANTGAVDEKFSKIRRQTTLAISIRNVANNALLTETMTVTVTIPQVVTKETTITGTGTVALSYPKNSTPTATMISELPGSYWIQCDQTGATVASTDSVPFTSSTVSSTIYMKSTRHTIAAIEGRVSIDNTEKDDDMLVWLAYEEGGKFIIYSDASATQVTYPSSDGSQGALVRHGLFANLGNGIEWDDDTYVGKFAEKEVILIFDANDDKTLSVGDRYFRTTVQSHKTTHNLGLIEPIDVIAIQHIP